MKRNFAIGASWTAASSWIEQAVSALSFLLIARFVGVEEFGVVAMTFSFLFLGEFLVRDTLTEAIIQRKVLEEGRLEATFVALIGFSAVIVAALVVIGQVAAAIYAKPAVAPMLMAASPTVLMIGAAGVSTALMRREMAYRALAIRSAAGVVCGGVVGVIMAMSGFGGWSLVVQRLVEIGVNSCFALLAAKWRPRAWPSRSHFLLMRGLGPQVVTLRSLMLVLGQTPTVALGIFADARAAGLFALAWRLAEIVRALIIKPMEGVAQSAFAMLRRKQTATASFFLDVNEIVALGALTSFVGLALIGEPLVGVLLGADWRESGLVLPFLCIAGSAGALTAIQQSYLLAIGRLGPYILALLLEAAIGLVLITLAGSHGPVIVAAAVALRAVCCLPFYVSATLAPEKMSLRGYLNSLSAPAIVATAILVVVGLLRVGASGYLPDAVFVPLAIALGGATAWVVLLTMMPNMLSRLKTFLTE